LQFSRPYRILVDAVGDHGKATLTNTGTKSNRYPMVIKTALNSASPSSQLLLAILNQLKIGPLITIADQPKPRYYVLYHGEG
jgi:hypothetical protein